MPKRTVELEGKSKVAVTVAYLDTDTYISSSKGKKTKKEKWMWDEWAPPNMQKRKVMVGLFLREQVKVTMTSHLYTIGGELCGQVSGRVAPQSQIHVGVDSKN